MRDKDVHLLKTESSRAGFVCLKKSGTNEFRNSELLRDNDRTVVGIVAGTAQSAASLVLQACRRRIVTRHSTLMLHRSKVGVGLNGGMSVEDAQSALDAFRRLDQRFYEIYAERSGKPVDTIAKLARSDTYFDAEEAVSFGLADDILDDSMFYGHEPELARLLLRPVDELELSIRSHNCLVNADIALIGELGFIRKLATAVELSI